MATSEKELRTYGEIRAVGEGRKVVGYAAVFDRESEDLGGFVEYIAHGAFDGVVEKSDVLALLNHDERRGLLARAKKGEGTLKLTIDDKGLRYEFDAPKTELGDELLEGLLRGDITASSFAFSVEIDEWTDNGRYKPMTRTIKKLRSLYDVSPVYRPAYPDTSVALSRRAACQDMAAYYAGLLSQIQ